MSDICLKIYKTLLQTDADKHGGQSSIICEIVLERMRIDGVINQSDFATITRHFTPLSRLVELFYTILPAKSFEGLAGMERVFRENWRDGLHADLVSIASNYFELNDGRIAKYAQLTAAINEAKLKQEQIEQEQHGFVEGRDYFVC